MDYTHGEHYFPSHTGNTAIYVQTVAPASGSIKGVIQIVHGMAEHTDRYLEVAKFLCDKGFAVIMHDQAGHGKSVKTDADNGYFCEKDGWKCLTEDVFEVTKLAKKMFSEKKIILWGHSMGSFIARNYLTKHPGAVDGAVICGTAGKNPAAGAGILLANLIIKLKWANYKAKLLDSIAFGSYNKGFEGSTGFEWLSVNKENVEKYVADPKCGFLFSASGFRDLFSVLNEVSGSTWYTGVPKDTKIYLIAGDKDPVGAYGKGVTEVYDKLISTGHTEVTKKLYPGLRHEIHNEDNRVEVYEDIAAFAEAVVGGQ